MNISNNYCLILCFVSVLLLLFFVCGIIYKSWCGKPKRGEEVRGVTHHGHKIVALWVIIMVSNLLNKNT